MCICASVDRLAFMFLFNVHLKSYTVEGYNIQVKELSCVQCTVIISYIDT